MFQSYLFPISYAFLTFPIAALLFTVPFLIIQYRRHGYIHKYRAVLLYLLLLYMMNAFYLVILPLPKTIHNDPLDVSSYMQWIPFQFIQDIIRETSMKLDDPITGSFHPCVCAVSLPLWINCCILYWSALYDQWPHIRKMGRSCTIKGTWGADQIRWASRPIWTIIFSGRRIKYLLYLGRRTSSFCNFPDTVYNRVVWIQYSFCNSFA